MVGSGKHEEFFMRFGGEVYQWGFQRAERIVPSGFPLLPHQPVYRYRKKQGSELFQIGPGVLTANAIPPYKSWTEFSPVVAQGIEALLKTRDESEKNQPFPSVSLRYIDAFTAKHTGSRDAGAFVREVLGITVGLPPAVSNQLAEGRSARFAVQIGISVRGSLELILNVGEGVANNQAALIMDTTVASTVPILPDKDALMAALNSARDIIHDLFIEMTRLVRDTLQPEEN
jgi:uncharacterized protein (TIGR04255 family)